MTLQNLRRNEALSTQFALVILDRKMRLEVDYKTENQDRNIKEKDGTYTSSYGEP